MLVTRPARALDDNLLWQCLLLQFVSAATLSGYPREIRRADMTSNDVLNRAILNCRGLFSGAPARLRFLGSRMLIEYLRGADCETEKVIDKERAIIMLNCNPNS